MSNLHTNRSAGEERTSRPGAQNFFTALLRRLDPSFLLAAICTGSYYAVILQPSMRNTTLYHYTTEHVVEYVIVGMFIWAMVDVLFKCMAYPGEYRALRQEWLPPCRGRESIANATVLLQQIRQLPSWQLQSRMGRALREMLEFIVEKGTAKDCRDFHQSLRDREDDRMHTDYSLLRFVVAVTPILGFLGTVVHFGTALSGMSFDEMTERLPAVVAEMGMAFNTTTVALAAAMTAMCMMFICERVERGILQTVDRFIEREVVTRFEVKEQQIEPFLAVIQSVHEAALGGIATTLERQFEVWNSKIDGLFSRFDSHQDNATAAWQAALSNLQEQHEQYSLSREDHVIESLGLIDAAGGRHLAMIQEILERVSEFRGELTGLTNTLEIIARGEGKLVDLQSTLSDNIHALRQSGQIDEALHGLTAAIHLMTVRHHPVKLQDAA